MADVTIKVEGIEKLQAALHKFPLEMARYLSQAGDEAAKQEVLRTQGLKLYPPATGANAPPTPYYIRGRGVQTASGNKLNSERLGTQWYVKKVGMGTEIGNRASYGRWVHGEEQASFMAPKGWRKLTDVVDEKMGKIVTIYQRWVNKLIKDLGL